MPVCNATSISGAVSCHLSHIRVCGIYLHVPPVCALVTRDTAPSPSHVVSLSVFCTMLDSTDALLHSNNCLVYLEQHMCSSALKSQQQTEQAVDTP